MVTEKTVVIRFTGEEVSFLYNAMRMTESMLEEGDVEEVIRDELEFRFRKALADHFPELSADEPCVEDDSAPPDQPTTGA